MPLLRTFLPGLALALAIVFGAAGGLASGRAAAAPPALDVYGRLPGLEMASLSPSGERVAMVGVIGNERLLVVLEGTRTVLSSVALGTEKVRGIAWGGEGNVLVWLSRTRRLGLESAMSRAEVTGVAVLPVGGSQLWWVFQAGTRMNSGIYGFYGTTWKDGRWYGYFGGLKPERSLLSGQEYITDGSPELYEIDLQSRQTRRIARRIEGTTYRTWLVAGNGQVAATLDYEPGSGDWFIANAGRKTIVQGRSRLGGAYFAGLGPAPDALTYRQLNEATGDIEWHEVPLAGGPSRRLFDGAVVRRVLAREGDRRIIGYETDGDEPRIKFLDPRHQKVMEATRRAFPGRRVELVDWSDSFNRLIVITDGPGESGTWWMVDIPSGTASDLGNAYPMRPVDVAPVRTVRYTAADGLALSGVLTLPPDRPQRGLPVIVLPHGGPASRDYAGFHWWAQALASRGYAVFQPNYRGSTGQGGTFERAGNGEWGRRMQTDMSDGLAALARDGIVDAQRACIMGGSFGGYAAMAGITIQQGLYRCAVSFAGMSDVASLHATILRASGRDPSIARQLRLQTGGGVNVSSMSPLRFAARADAPILLIHGRDDTVVPFEQSERMAKALRKAGKAVSFLPLEGEDHWLSKSETRLAMLKAAIAFVEQHNPPDPPPGD